MFVHDLDLHALCFSVFQKSFESNVLYSSVKINVINNGMHTWGNDRLTKGNTDGQRTQ